MREEDLDDWKEDPTPKHLRAMMAMLACQEEEEPGDTQPSIPPLGDLMQEFVEHGYIATDKPDAPPSAYAIFNRIPIPSSYKQAIEDPPSMVISGKKQLQLS